MFHIKWVYSKLLVKQLRSPKSFSTISSTTSTVNPSAKFPEMFTSWQRKFDGDLVIPNLYLGSVCTDKESLQSKQITHILTVSDEFPPAHPDFFTYMVINVDDYPGANLVDTFHEAADFIDKGRQSGAVFVHCAAGISRSPTVVTAYLLLRSHASTPTEALSLIKKTRPFVSPNSGFMRQINAFHESKFNIQSSKVTSVKKNTKTKS